MATSGRVSVDVVADFTRFAGDFQRQIQSSISGVTVDMSGVANGIQRGLTQGAEAGFVELRRQSDATVSSLQGVSAQSRDTGQSIQSLAGTVTDGSYGMAAVAEAAQLAGIGLVAIADGTESASGGMTGLATVAVDGNNNLIELAATMQITGEALSGVAEAASVGGEALVGAAAGAETVSGSMTGLSTSTQQADQELEQTADSANSADTALEGTAEAAQQTDQALGEAATAAETTQQDLAQVADAGQQADQALTGTAAGATEAQQDLAQVADASQQADQALSEVATEATDAQQELNQVGEGARQADQGLTEVAAGAEEARQDLNQVGDAAQGVEQDLNQVGSQATAVGRNLSEAFVGAGRSMASAGDAMTASLTLPIVALGGLTVNVAGDFEQAMNKVKAVTEATGTEFSAMRQEAIDLGSSTAFSSTEAAEGMYELASAGFDTTQIMEALPGVLDMASAGSVGLADAAEIASGILNGYGFTAKDLTMVNDVLARDFLATATSLSDLGESFQYVAPTAKSAGLSFTETAAAIGLMGNAGIKGSSAGTGLNAAIGALVKPSKDAQNTLRDLGVTVTNSSGKMLPLVDIVRQLSDSGADTADMMTIFGLEAGPKMQALVSQGADALAALDVELQNSGGTAQQVATTQMAGFNGAMDELSSAAEGLMIAIGDAGVLGFVTDLAKGLTDLVMKTAQLSPGMLRAAAVFATVLAAIGPVLMIVGRLSVAIGFVGGKLKLFWAWLVRVAPAMTALSGPLGWIIAGIAALALALFVAYKKFDGFRNAVDNAFRVVAAAATWLYQSIFLPIFTAIGAVVMSAWSGTIRPALVYMGQQFGVAAASIAGFWSGSIRPAFAALVEFLSRVGVAIRSWWVGNGDTVMAAVVSTITWMGGILTTVLGGVMNIFRVVATVIAWAISAVAIPFLTAMVSTILSLGRTLMGLHNVWKLIGTVIAAVGTVVVSVLVAAFKILQTAINASISNFLTLANFLGGLLGPVFAAIGSVIQAFIGKAATFLTGTLVPAFNVAAAALNQFAGRVMAFLAPVGAVLAQVGGIIASAFTTYVLPALAKFGTAMQVIITVATWLWTTLSPLLLAIANLVWVVWTGVLSIVFNLLKLAITVLIAIIQVLWPVFQVAFTIIGAVLMALWAIAQPILSALGALFMWLWGNVISPVLSAMGALFMWLAGVVTTVFNAIVAVVKWAISALTSLVSGLSGFVNAAAGYFQSFVNAVNEKINAAINYVRGLPGAILNAVGSLGGILYEAGKSIIQGLINGIGSMIGSLRDTMSSVASSVRDFLPFSPAKVGPLSGSGDPTISGGKITSMIATGLEERIPAIRAAIGAVTQTTSTGITALPDLAAGLTTPLPMPVTAGRTAVGNTYYLTVNAIDPKSAADSVMAAIGTWERSNGKGWRA